MTTKRRCPDVGGVLSAYVDHEATAEEMAIVEAHALTCRGCAARLKRYRALIPRLEADVRSLMFEADSAAGQIKRTRFRGPPERMGLEAPPVRLFSRALTVALGAAMMALAALVLIRSAPTGRSPGLETAAQPSAPSPGPTTTDPTPVTPDRPPVVVAAIGGLVDPAVAAYVRRAVAAAEDGHAAALVVVLDASGGLDGSMQQVAQDLANSMVPTLAFIAPGRTETEANVRLAQSSELGTTATSPNLTAFLRSVDGQPVQTPTGLVTLATAGARIENFDMEPLEALAHRLMDPTTAYLLFVLGLYAVFVEVAHPGALLPGATGLVCLSLASLAFVMLPTNWLGVAMLVGAVGLMALELKAASHGALVLAGVVCLIVGSLLLYATPGSAVAIQTDVSVAPGVLIGAAATGLVVGLLLARIARRIHNLPPLLSLDELIGARGVSRGGLNPEGVVHVGGQLWSARLRGGQLEADQPVRVVARHGLVLEVESAALGAATRKGTLS
jgi:membrane-bound ClpP family serine protease